ncbi:MAG: CbiX/SirB N-terminal domain-containing protein [Hyphomicrobiaceae bacterium]|nr:CbiX/SirB N-terminal domain-containing protein [Hyphomicrobiaceae bacterium]
MRCHPASAEMAVVLAAHGDRGAGLTNSALLSHRQVLDDTKCFANVGAGVLKGEPALEDALAAAEASSASRIAIYPFFMADGFFVRTRLAERVAGANLTKRWEIFPPLGVDPGLPALMLDHAEAAAKGAGFAAATSTLLLAGHGSQLGPASADATRATAAAIKEANVFADVVSAFLEEPPSIEDALRVARGPVVVSGFFSGEGLHAGDDVPDAIAKSGATAIYAGPIGRDRSISDLIFRRLNTAR